MNSWYITTQKSIFELRYKEKLVNKIEINQDRDP